MGTALMVRDMGHHSVKGQGRRCARGIKGGSRGLGSRVREEKLQVQQILLQNEAAGSGGGGRVTVGLIPMLRDEENEERRGQRTVPWPRAGPAGDPCCVVPSF